MIKTTETEPSYAPGDPVWYGGYEHRVTAVHPNGHVSVESDRPGAPTAFQGYSHVKFVTARETGGSKA